MKEDTVIIDGKIYISSRRAGRLFGYSLDYIGQLARAGKIQSRFIGRNRFVEKGSLLRYRQSGKNSDNTGQDLTRRITREAIIPQNKPRPTDIIVPSPLPPPVQKIIGRQELVALSLILLLLLPFGLSRLADFIFDFDPGIVAMSAALAESPAGAESFQEKIKTAAVQLDQRLFDYLEGVQKTLLSFFGDASSKLSRLGRELRRFVVGEPEVTEVVVIGEATPAPPQVVTVPAEGLDEEQVRLIVEKMLAEERARLGLAPEVGPRPGLAVFPSTGDKLADEKLVQYIRDSFSDQVIVELDESRRAGIVTPVFRRRAEDSYVFVLVPVEEVGSRQNEI